MNISSCCYIKILVPEAVHFITGLDSFILFLWDGWSLSSSSPVCDPMIRYLLLSEALPVELLREIYGKMLPLFPSSVFLSAPESVATDLPISSCQEVGYIFPFFESGLAFRLSFLCFHYFLGILPLLLGQAKETLLNSNRNRSLLPLLFYW